MGDILVRNILEIVCKNKTGNLRLILIKKLLTFHLVVIYKEPQGKSTFPFTSVASNIKYLRKTKC